MTWSIRPLDRTRDADELVSLWQRALPRWPIRRDRLLAATPGGHVIEHEGRLAGAIAVHPAGGISYLLVDPEMRWQGIGSALHDAAIASLAQHRHVKAVLGSGGRPYVWPGIPRDLPDAERFFAERGWVTRGVSADLVQDLAAYATPPDALDRAAEAGVTPSPPVGRATRRSFSHTRNANTRTGSSSSASTSPRTQPRSSSAGIRTAASLPRC